MKQTTDGRWAHLACAIWIPGYKKFKIFYVLHLRVNLYHKRS